LPLLFKKFSHPLDKHGALCYNAVKTLNTDNTEEVNKMAWNFSGKQDVYLEIADKLRQYIHAGVYQAGDRLPSVRAAAGEMGVNPNTVARAYALLEEEGLIRALPKKGAYVTYGTGAAEREQALADCRAMLARIRQSGVSREELIALAEEVFAHD
jgi:GntR family transcriptional regulator